MLVKNPGFTAIAVLSIGLGISANTTVFSVLNAVRFRPLPFKDPGRLVMMTEVNPGRGGERYPTFGTYAEWKRQSRSFESMGLAGPGAEQSFHGSNGAERVRCESFDLDLQSVLGINPVLGRRILKEDKNSILYYGTVLISYDFWQREFGGAKDVIGRKIVIADADTTIIGVMPPGFSLFPWDKDGQVWGGVDLSGMPTTRYLFKIGRLKPGVTLQQAQVELATISRHLDASQTDSDKGWAPHLEPLREAYLGYFQQDIYFLLGAVGFVLLIACANVANLLLARGNVRRKEFAIRASVGAGRARLFQQALTESVLISLLGGVLGLVLTFWGIKTYIRLAPQWFPLTQEVRIDGRVLAFTTAISLLSGLLFGLIPALHTSKTDLVEMLKEGGRGSGPAARRLTRALLLVSETALAVALLAGASLMIGSYRKAVNIDLGYDPRHLLTLNFRLSTKKYFSDLEGGSTQFSRQGEAFYQQLLERVRSLPGVESAGITSGLQGWDSRRFSIIGHAPDKPEDRPYVAFNEVDAGLFPTLNIHLLRGRFVEEQDVESSPWVVVVNETLARRFFRDQDPIGRSIRLTMNTPVRGMSVDEDRPRVIIGVVKDVKFSGTDKNVPALYTSYRQHPWVFPQGNIDPYLYKTLVVRTPMAPAGVAQAVRRAAAAIDPKQAPFDAVTLDKLLADSLAEPRFMMQLVSLFAGFAVVLAAVGIYGVTFYLVSQRRHELAVRAAMGAQNADLTWLVVNGTVKLALVGGALGCLVTFGLSAILKRFLFGVESINPKMLLGGALLMTAVGTLASYLPARRAARVDPMAALRNE
jgi:putative ABC transport system permease protein